MSDRRHEVSSPKRFFKNISASPFRLLDLLSPDSQHPSSAHIRSHSHDFLHRRKHLDTNWTSLIPPLPLNPDSPSFKAADPVLNRHSIAVSPVPRDLPDMLQPLANPDQERPFIIERNDRNTPRDTTRDTPRDTPRDIANPFVTKSKPGTPLQPQFHSLARPRNPQLQNQQLQNQQFQTQQFQTPQTQNQQPPSLSQFQSLSQYQSLSQFQGLSQYQNLSQYQGLPFPNQQLPQTQQLQNSPRPSNAPPNLPQLSRNQQPIGHPPKTPDSKLMSRFLASPKTPSTQNQPPGSRSRQLQTMSPFGSPVQQTPRLGNPPSQFVPQSQSAQPQTQQTPKASRLLPDPLLTPTQDKKSLQRAATKRRKNCKTCGQVISGQFVRALNSAYHIECFTCFKCGNQCSSKFFPHDVTDRNGNTVQVPLCEYDYFKQLDLICAACDSALRGPYITALGNKFHLDHFKCSACGKVFESDESYYEHENNIYCHFHYSKLFATKCEGCQSSIVKQFVELFKGGRNQQWHPECYMVFKFWNVSVTADCVGLPEKLGIAYNTSNIDEIEPKDLLMIEQQIENAVMKCWMILSGFEEIAASCISEMLLCACTGKRNDGLAMTGRLVVFVEILFNALDFVQGMCLMYLPDKSSVQSNPVAEEIYSIDAFDKFQTLRKEPRNISGKLMSYLAILRKSSASLSAKNTSADLLSVVTGTAHYLKLMIRIGLNNALRLNKLRSDSKALEGFLRLIKRYEEVDITDKLQGESRISISSRLVVPYNATDSCVACLKSIEKACVAYKSLRWHLKCFECSNCHRKASQDFKIESFLWGQDNKAICTDCARKGLGDGSGYVSGFVKVSDLSQLAYLLRIAIFRSKFAIKKNDVSLAHTELTTSTRMTNIEEEPTASDTETDYSRTLSDITSLRAKRESQKLSNSIKKNARKSVILEAPEATIARESNMAEEGELSQRKASTVSTLSFVPEADSDQFDFSSNSLKIRDDPPENTLVINLDRTYDLLKNEKALTLDDIPRIVAAEQAREQRPNAFKHHNSLYAKKDQPVRTVSVANDDMHKDKSGMPNINYVSSYSKYYSELTKRDHFILRHIAVEALLEMKSEFSKDELATSVATKKAGTFWDKFKFGGDKTKHINVFGSDLKEVNKKYGVDSDLGVGPAQLRIPILVDDIIKALRQKDMSVEGIFRLNGNIKNLRELTEQINKSPLKSPDFGKYSAVQLAALMKKWLRELTNPLLTFELYDLWISSRREKDPAIGKRILQLACCMLPRSHRSLLEVLLYFFNWVASFAEIDEETGSKMDVHNLATVIAPNILLPKSSAQDGVASQSGESHFYGIEVVNQLIEMHEELAVIPSDLWAFFEKCQFLAKADAMSSKDIFGITAKVLKENPQFFSRAVDAESSGFGRLPNSIKKGHTVVYNPNA